MSEKIEIYKKCLKKLNFNNHNMYDLYEKYLKNTGLKDNITTIKLYFERNIFISIKEYKSGNYKHFFVDGYKFKQYMRDNPTLKKKLGKAKSKKEYKILLRKINLRQSKFI